MWRCIVRKYKSWRIWTSHSQKCNAFRTPCHFIRRELLFAIPLSVNWMDTLDKFQVSQMFKVSIHRIFEWLQEKVKSIWIWISQCKCWYEQILHILIKTFKRNYALVLSREMRANTHLDHVSRETLTGP